MLSAVLTAVLLMFGAPLSPAPPEPDHGAPDYAIALAGPGPHAVAHPTRDAGTSGLALPSWSGDHRPQALRDIAVGLSPAAVLLPDLGGPWALAPLPESAAPPDLPEPFRLPLGRAPPLTSGM
ncbi:hypothetical protein ACFOVU_02640 [Nocardiopsis sediminis]|uniref:Uncharacterized protein n=1 Tax=Nocardiopsis sediminis TaxID=1778267 RepID=A0ABV8FFF2_9ACTN